MIKFGSQALKFYMQELKSFYHFKSQNYHENLKWLSQL